ncbi:hypothetical protein RQP46_009625 [Phenoliferia psychrophenolica]
MATMPQLYYAVPSSVRSGRLGVFTDKDDAKRQTKAFRTFTTRAEAEKLRNQRIFCFSYRPPELYSGSKNARSQITALSTGIG